MKKFFTSNKDKVAKVCRPLLMALVFVSLSIGLSSCYVDASWNPEPPSYNTFYDSRLNGYWELVSINNRNVYGDAVNYLYFNGDGRGRYYYFNNGIRYWEYTSYWCQQSASGQSNYQVNLQYESSGSPTTMNYWFSNGRRYLTLQWYNSYGWQTYVYGYYSSYNAPW